MKQWGSSNRWQNHHAALRAPTPSPVLRTVAPLPFEAHWVRRGGHDFECRFFLDGAVVVSCDALIQTERFLPGQGSIRLEDAESFLIDRILAANHDKPAVRVSE